MGENNGRSGDNQAVEMDEPTFVQAGKKDNESGSPILQESFLQQLTGSPGRGKGIPTPKKTKASSPSKSKGPIAAGDVISKKKPTFPSLEALGRIEVPDASDTSMHPSAPSWPSAPGQPEDQQTNQFPFVVIDPPSLLDSEDGPESHGVMDQFRRVVYPPTDDTPSTELPAPTSSTTEHPSMTEANSPFAEVEQPPKKKSVFDSFSSDADASFTGIDPIPAYLRAAVNNATKTAPTFSAVTQQTKLEAITSSFRSARSIHLQPLETEPARPAPVRTLQRARTPAVNHFPLQMPAYSHAAAGNVFMYRPRIPSLRWVKVDNSTFRINELTEQLEEYAPWIVGALFLIASFLATFILFSI